MEKKLRSNPNNKIEGKIVPGNLIGIQPMRIDAASWAILFPNKTPKEIEGLLAPKPDATITPQMKKN